MSRNGASRKQDAAPRYVAYDVRVAGRRMLSPSFVRVTFAAECLRAFGSGGVDQRVKLILPQPGRTTADFPRTEDWYARWQALPDEVRPTLRTYTVREHRPERGELDIDFVLHGVADGHGGPASTWAANTEVGDEIALLGPDRPGRGRMWGCEFAPPKTTRQLVLAGDETAVPAIASIVESLPADARGIVCAEVPTAGDVQQWRTPAQVEVRWVVREQDSEAPHGSLLERAVTSALEELREARQSGEAPAEIDLDSSILWEVPEAEGHRENADGAEHRNDGLYGWLAGEAEVIKRLRRTLVSDHGVPRSSVAFMGYWRAGHC